MSVKHALLALLADGPHYGYELKAEFERATGGGWALNIGQVYSTLQRLERDEFIKPHEGPDAEGRQSYVLTADGRDVVEEWLATPLEEASGERDVLSMKLLVALATDITPVFDAIDAQRQASMGQLQNLTARKSARTLELAERLHLDRTILLLEAQLKWLDLAENRLEHEYESGNFPTTPNARLPKESR